MEEIIPGEIRNHLMVVALKEIVFAEKESLECFKECAEQAFQEVEGYKDEEVVQVHRRTMDLIETALAWHKQKTTH